MEERRKRVLMCSEASFLSTGYSTYTNEVLRRLHATGKFEVGEFSSYGQVGDPRAASIPWKYWTAMPDPNVPGEVDRYNASPLNQFGAWKFEAVANLFRPDAIFSIRDFWMDSFLGLSPFRPFYHWSYMPTVDASPQDEEWIATFMNADAVFTYSDWAQEILRQQSNGKIRLKCPAPPGANLDHYHVVADRCAHKESMGIRGDSLILGMVARNQKRKLFPDLAKAFALFLREAPKDIASRTYMYWHTCWPDVGWDLPRLIKEAGIAHKVLFTYACRKCGSVYPSFFNDARTVCRQCGEDQATFPSSHAGVDTRVLGKIVNLFDCYVQYSNSEGHGLPQVEAAACGVPVFSVDYSAMSDVVRKLKGFPIKVKHLARECETHCYRAIPDNEDFVRQLIGFLTLPSAVRAKLGFDARRAVEEHYTWDKTAKIWEDHFDSVEIRPLSQTWESPPRFHRPNLSFPDGLSNERFVRWGMEHVAGRPDLLNSYLALRMLRDLNWGASLQGMGGVYQNELSTLGMNQSYRDFTRQQAVEEMLRICDFRNHWETERLRK